MRKILFLLMTCSLIQAAQSQKIPFQGKLTENDEPVTGTKNMVFAIQSVGWTETHANVSVLDGFYSVILGSVTPLPENLFAGVDEVSLQITIDGTVLSPVTLYAPIAGGLLLPVELQTTGADTSLVVNLTGETVGFASALQVNSRTSGLNRAIIARTEEAGSNASSQYAISGRADGPGTGQHIGVLGSAFNTSATGEPRFGLYGQANSLAKYNYGVNGVATGTGNGDEGEGFGVGSINFGLRGYAANNTWNNTGVEAETAGEAGKVSYAVSGLAHAGIGDTVKNYALAGRAYGPGINYGVYGTAWNGTQNWAGWFDGNVNVNGQLMVNGQAVGTAGSVLDSLKVHGPARFRAPNDTTLAGYDIEPGFGTVLRGLDEANVINSYNWVDGGAQAANRGAVFLFADAASRNQDGVDVRRAEFKISDDGFGKGVGRLRLMGPQIGEFGVKGFFEAGTYTTDGSNYMGRLMVRGMNSETPLSEITVERDTTGVERGVLKLRDSQGGEFALSSRGMDTREVKLNNEMGEIKANLKLAPSGSGDFTLFGANDSLKVRMGTRTLADEGALYLFDSARASQVAIEGRTSGGRIQLANIKEGAFTSGLITSVSGGNSFVSMFGTNKDLNNVSLLTDMYTTSRDPQSNEYSGNYRRGGVDFYDNEGTRLAALGSARDENGSDPTGKSGLLFLWGTSTPNVELTGKRWENADLPTLRLYGNTPTGDNWAEANAVLDVWSFEGRTAGSLHLYNAVEGESPSHTVDITSNGVNNGGQIVLRNAIGNDIVRIQDRASTGQAHFLGSDGGLKTEIGSFGDNSGFLIMYGPNGNKNVQLDRNPGNTNLGQFNLFGTNGIDARVLLSVDSDSLNEWGYLRLDGPAGGISMDGSGSYVNIGDFFNANGIWIDGSAGNVDATGTIAAQFLSSADGTVQTSDGRLKTNIRPLENALANLTSLRGVTYNWIDPKRTQSTQIGVIAQEVEAVYPQFVHTDENGMKAVNYAQMVAVLIEAVKELNQKVETLEQQNAALKASLENQESADLAELRAEVESIKKLLLLKAGAENVPTVGGN